MGSREYPLLAAAAARLLGMHVTTAACERHWSVWGSTYTKLRSRLAVERTEKLIFVRANTKWPQADDEEMALRLLEGL